ncbi:MAG: hypothetical protein ACKO0Z_12150 [Betaproteobacteria bacterium]
MNDTPKLDDGAFDMDAEWECEHCQRKVRFGDTALSWCLNIICGECFEKEHDSPNKAIYRDMWAVVFPDGHIVTGSDLQTEADAWRIALGWPGPEEIEDVMKRGAFAVKARLRYYSPNDEKLCDVRRKRASLAMRLNETRIIQ